MVNDDVKWIIYTTVGIIMIHWCAYIQKNISKNVHESILYVVKNKN